MIVGLIKSIVAEEEEVLSYSDEKGNQKYGAVGCGVGLLDLVRECVGSLIMLSCAGNPVGVGRRS